ncbi:sugar-binding transcriptional regulator [Falsochrobactrum ovis]|uniref:DNA-binding transcriptional regulator LsrR (DeoR family) n=1 Tax=Falsochrobactrum ovis TaxID=1293442 RepID=A0A364JSN3_9HYPH|nr:sugar-binding transcriptional regulator [Falsochrobactrum ovis]RAK26113.1 DNA-binding transcriptional regulator LsrR (DeoR family) [Falsochrobactrum ovis]
MADNDKPRLDDAARAGWLYYISGKTQDEIAQMLGVSRPTAQRLVSQCRSEGLITFRMNHPIANCVELAERLSEKFDLAYCDIVPSDGAWPEGSTTVPEAAAVFIERQLRSRTAIVMALGTGRTMRASVQRVSPLNGSAHRLVSLVGHIGINGSASPFDALIKLSETVNAQHFPLLLPLYLSSAQERDALLGIEPVRRVHELASTADLWLTGISDLAADSSLAKEGFLSRDELFELNRLGGIGEICGWAFDIDGKIIESPTNLRITSVSPQINVSRQRICVASGERKVQPLLSALRGQLINGLITDEDTAMKLING